MIKIVAKMNVKPEQITKFKEISKELVEKSRSEEGNISYTLNESIIEENVLAFIEIWKDQTSINIHNETEHFKGILPILVQMCESEPEITLYKEV